MLLGAGCASRQSVSARLGEVKSSAELFARSVAEEVTRQGPAAWQGLFQDSPSFFMAADGRLQFPDGAAGQAGIPALTRTIKRIELQWGKDLKVDPLTEHLAMIGTSWHEVLTLANGNRLDTSGYFTGLAENRNGRWQFRNAHWSTVNPSRVPN